MEGKDESTGLSVTQASYGRTRHGVWFCVSRFVCLYVYLHVCVSLFASVYVCILACTDVVLWLSVVRMCLGVSVPLPFRVHLRAINIDYVIVPYTRLGSNILI